MRFEARFDDAWWRRDLIRSDAEGRAVARRARVRYGEEGIDPSELRACLADGPDGTELANCVKSYLGARVAGKPYGMVFVADVIGDSLFLRYVGFGERHPKSGRRSVYQLAAARVRG